MDILEWFIQNLEKKEICIIIHYICSFIYFLKKMKRAFFSKMISTIQISRLIYAKNGAYTYLICRKRLEIDQIGLRKS